MRSRSHISGDPIVPDAADPQGHKQDSQSPLIVYCVISEALPYLLRNSDEAGTVK